MVASDVCVLNLDEEDLPKSSLSVILVGTASDNSEIGDDKITLNLNAREYIDNQNNKSLSFDLYHFPEDSHLLPITSKVSRGLSLYVTGSLSLIGDLLLVRLTQINFIENIRSTPYKTSNYAWEKKQDNDSSTQSTPSASEIAKSLSSKPNKRKVKTQATALSRSLKIPKLASLALPQSNTNDDPQEESSLSISNLNVDDDPQNEIQPDISDNRNEQDDEIRPQRKARGNKKK
jgi:ABC-type enterochelin transport system, permease component